MRLTQHYGALSSRNYRLYFGGQIVSFLGTWMTQTASAWLVYHLSLSPFLLGMMAFGSSAPGFFLAPFAGVLVDRVDRHRLLMITQVSAMLQSFALAALALTDTINIPRLIFLAFVQGVINAIDIPLRQAMVSQFVERREHMPSAIALNSSIFNFSRLIGPALAGFVIAAYGAGICYLIDGFSYVAVIAALLAMKLPARPPRPQAKHPLAELREGLHHAFGFAPIRALIILVAAVSSVSFTYAVLIPVFARDIFHGDARSLGVMMSATGIGALFAALYLGKRPSVRGLGRVITLGGSCLGSAVICYSLSRWMPLSLLCLVAAGAGGVLMMASANTLVQSMVDDDKRGRVMSLFTMAFNGAMPLGSLIAGWCATKIGAPTTLTVSGTLTLVIILVFNRNLPRLRDAARPVLAAMEEAP